MLVVELISHYIFDIRLMLQLRVCTRLKRRIDKYEHVASYLKIRNGHDTYIISGHHGGAFPRIYLNNVGILFASFYSNRACLKQFSDKVKYDIPTYDKVCVESDSYKFGNYKKYHTELTKTGIRTINLKVPKNDSFKIGEKTYRYMGWRFLFDENNKRYDASDLQCHTDRALFVAGQILFCNKYYTVKNVYWISVGSDHVIFAIQRTKYTHDIILRKF